MNVLVSNWFSLLAALSTLQLAACSDDADDGRSPQPSSPSALVTFDPAQGELPEGLALEGGFAYVGFAPTGRIDRVSLGGDATRTAYGNLPAPPADGFMTGIAFGPDARLYAALVSPAVTPKAGIYRLPEGGGEAELFASDDKLPFPNGLAFDAAGQLYVTDSGVGAVHRIASDGTLSEWISHSSLAGQVDFCGPGLGTFDIGANGIALGDGVVYVANNDKGSIIRIPIESDGTAGTPSELVPPDCDTLGGADGITLAADGSLWVAVNRQNRLARVDASGAVSIVAEGGVLDFPASLSIGDGNLIITSFALGAALSGGDPKPALVELALP